MRSNPAKTKIKEAVKRYPVVSYMNYRDFLEAIYKYTKAELGSYSFQRFYSQAKQKCRRPGLLFLVWVSSELHCN